MSKPSSGLFAGTIGSKNAHQQTNYHNNSTQNHRHVVLWAEETARSFENISKRKRDKFNTATVAYDESTGKYYYGQNGGIEQNKTPKNPLLFGSSSQDGLLPTTSLNNYALGNCSEVDAINNALNAGASLRNLHITTIHTTKHSMGKPKAACENCTYSFRGKIKRNYTGWHKEDNNE